MKALKELNLKDIIFIDIESARIVKELEIDTPLFDSWEYKKRNEKLDNQGLINQFRKEAGLYPEFARIVCISVGRIKGDKISVKTYNDLDEKVLLQNFNTDLELVTNIAPSSKFCGHSIDDFDIPFIFKRCLINGIQPHELLDTADLKPWNVPSIDTKKLWKGTSYSPTSLINIAVAFGLKSPKDDIDGSEVGDVFWGDDPNRVERISKYCEKDVVTTANIVRKCRFESVLEFDAPIVEEQPELITHLFNGGKYDESHKEKLLNFLKGLEKDEQDKALVILESIVSGAAGKKTKFTKQHVKELKSLL